ncbi:MAG: hypothetical protein K0S27_1241, partial [Gammaproteobacteria bacterium]|nr:hypothetical protein [Gammaproteobacteria bacterium]
MQASSRSPELMVPHSRLQRLEASHALEAFLGTIQRMQVEKRDAYFGAGKKYDLPVPTLIAKPQVFFSYAWGKENEPRFIQLQTFLKEMSHYLKKAGVQVWFDLDRMVGDVESQMRDGVSRSHVVLLFGTETYSKKTGVGSQTNVKKELDFTLEKAAHDKHCLMPLLLEGTFKTTFPSLGYKYLMVDATSW